MNWGPEPSSQIDRNVLSFSGVKLGVIDREIKAPNCPWSCLAIAAFLPFVGSLFYFVIAGDNPVGRVCYGLVKLFTLLWPLIVYKWILKKSFPWRRESKIPFWRSLGEGGLLGVAIGAVLLLAMETPLGSLVRDSAGAIGGKVDDIGIRAHYWGFALLLSLGHSLLEEYYWRGFLFTQLAIRMPLRCAHILAGLAFSLHHIVICTQYFTLVWGILLGGTVAIAGLFWSLLYQRHGHIWGAWISHIIADLVLMYIGAQLIFG